MRTRRLLILFSFPLLIVIFGLFALQSAVRSTWVWIMSGAWLLPEDLPDTWADRLGTRLERWLCKWMG